MGDLKGLVSVKITRDYGLAGTVEYQAVSDSHVPMEGSTIQADLLTSQVLKWFDHFEAQVLPTIKGAKKVADVSTVVVPAEEIAVEMKDGKRRYRVKCGQWMKHGVDFYPEHMKACGIDPRAIPDDGYKPRAGTMAHVQLEGGVAKRVLKLVAAGN